MITKRILILWYIRVIFVSAILLVLLTGFLWKYHSLLFLAFGITLAASFLLFYLRYRSLDIVLSRNHITLTYGALIKRNLCLNLSNIEAIESLSTPLSEKLRLAHLVIYCRGKKLLTFPLDETAANILRKKLKSAKSDHYEENSI